MMPTIAIKTAPPTAIPMTASVWSLVDEATALSGEDGVAVALGGLLTGAVAGIVGSAYFISARSISTQISLPENLYRRNSRLTEDASSELGYAPVASPQDPNPIPSLLSIPT
jgi:hypothetical protein